MFLHFWVEGEWNRTKATEKLVLNVVHFSRKDA